MVPGHFSYVVYFMVLALMCTGWKSAVCGRCGALTAAAFFAGWPIGQLVTVEVGSHLSISGSIVPVLFVCAAAIRKSGSAFAVVQLCSTAMLIAAAYVLLRQWIPLQSASLAYDRIWYASSAAALIAVLLVPSWLSRMAAVSLGLLCGDGLFFAMSDSAGTYVAGSLDFFDQWWLAVAAARLMTLVSGMLGRIGRAAGP